MLTRVEIPGLICAGLLILGGGMLGVWHWRTWQHQLATLEPDPLMLWTRCRRRMQVAGLIAIEGGLLAIGDAGLPLLQRAAQITTTQMAFLWAGVVVLMLLVAVWIALLAVGDIAITASRNRLERLRMRQEQRALHDEIERYREARKNDEV